MASRTDPVYGFGMLALAATLLLALFWGTLGLDGPLAWLLSVNLVTFTAYGYDKAIAGSGKTRVPEAVLLALALLGGTLGAFVGMRLFHHKTAKARFQIRFWIIALAQITLVVLYYSWTGS